ncbi:CML8 [Symbiodinium sp. CCMP2592]|nr:CML8 [Symbiodinium sp. CCMP2592]
MVRAASHQILRRAQTPREDDLRPQSSQASSRPVQPFRSSSPHTEWQSRILEELTKTSKRGRALPTPRYKKEPELSPLNLSCEVCSTDCSDGKLLPEEESPQELKRPPQNDVKLTRSTSELAQWLPDITEVISRLRAGADGFSSTEMDRINTAFQRFKDPDNPEIHKDELPKVLMHLGYTQIHDARIRDLADGITRYPMLEKAEFITFMEKHVEYELHAFRDIFERFDADGNGCLDAGELHVFLSSLGFTPLRSIIRESLDLVDLDGNGTLDFEETVILMHVYRHSEGFTLDELQELTAAFVEQTGANGKMDDRTLPADRLQHLLISFFGPRATQFSTELQEEIIRSGRRKSNMDPQGDKGPPPALTFQEAVLWARRFRERMFTSYRDVFDKFDDDGNDSIDLREIKNVIRELGFTIPQKTVHELIVEARRRGDILNSDMDGLDYDSFVHFMQLLNENDGFNKQEIDRIAKTFKKYDKDGSGDINTLELSDMMREMGQAPRIEEVRTLLSAVDINGNGVLDEREFIRFSRLFREKQLARAKMVFMNHADRQLCPEMIPASQVDLAIHVLLADEAIEVAPLPPEEGPPKDQPIEFDEFVELADRMRERLIWTSKKFAGFGEAEVNEIRQIFDSFDTKRAGSLKPNEASELLKSLGIEVRSVEERIALSEQIATACQEAQEAGAEAVVDGQVNFWVFLQLFRAMKRKQDEEKERRLMSVCEEVKFNSQEVNQFQEVFEQCWSSLYTDGVTSDTKQIPRTAVYKLFRNMGMRLEGRNRQALDDQLNALQAQKGIDFPNFLLLMRWMLDVDFCSISSSKQPGT